MNLKSLIIPAAVAIFAVSGGVAAGAAYADEFNGPAGSPPNPAIWQPPPWTCANDPNATQTCLKPSNAALDGNGNLVLKVTAPGTQGRPYDGAHIRTWVSANWPPTSFQYATRPHTRIEARIKYGGDPGVWGAFWAESVDPTYVEFDISEVRLGLPQEAGCHIPTFNNWGGAATVDDVRNWHVYVADYYSDHIAFYADDQLCGQFSFPAGWSAPRIGLEFDNVVGAPGTWGGEGGPPSPPGTHYEADMLVDYVRVTEF
jgi:beta-glucanase (GH16 family)